MAGSLLADPPARSDPRERGHGTAAPAPPSGRTRWPLARAVLISLAIVIALIDGCPIPPSKRTPEWARPVMAKLASWRRTLLSPVAWLGRDLDIQQRWSLFRGASRRRFRLYLEGQTATGEWVILFRAGDPEHTEYAGILEYRRVRGTFAPSGQSIRGQYPAFALWMINRVLADHPELVAGRTRMERVEIGQGEYRPTGEFAFEQVRRRGPR
jgi:hypothetical protein